MAHKKHHGGHHHSTHAKHSMHGATMPKEHFERHERDTAPVSGLKYAGEFSNPQDLDRAEEGLANYVKKHQMKY